MSTSIVHTQFSYSTVGTCSCHSVFLTRSSAPLCVHRVYHFSNTCQSILCVTKLRPFMEQVLHDIVTLSNSHILNYKREIKIDIAMAANPSTSRVTSTRVKDHDYLFKIVIIGDSGVGKSSILLRFADDTYNESYISTIGVDYRFRTVRQPNGKKAKLQIWDTAGQERFKTVTAAYYRGADGIVMVYDATNPRSFAHVKEWLSEVSKYTTQDTIKILVGNKCDRIDKFISSEKGAALAKNMNVHFIETSAKYGTNVDKIFNVITQELVASRECERVKETDAIAQQENKMVRLEENEGINKKKQSGCTC